MIRLPSALVLFALAWALVGTSESVAQESGWDGPRALALIEQARAVRQSTSRDSALNSYRAEARGRVYFLIDRPDTDERTLVRADQIALEIYWKAPRLTRQRIVGLRDEEVLPTNIHYHLDHLTVVQDEFGDQIRLGDGDEVSAVVHPAAPGSGDHYRFRLQDSLTLSFPGGEQGDVRVYEVQVRPRNMDDPGYVGSVFLDRDTGAIVRMSFTFTPASYVDPYLDYIRISLDNLLWDGKYWLPYRQEAELRRELPQLDFLAGSIIRGRFDIRGYEFDVGLEDTFFRGPRVTTVPESARESFPFEEPLFADLDEEGLETPPSLEDVRARARRIVREQYLSGLSPIRLHLTSASDAVRHNRAEGTYVGAGAVFRPGRSALLRMHAGYAFAREKPSARVSVRSGGDSGWEATAFWNQLRDLGPLPAISGVLNTISSLGGGRDHLDPYFVSGVEVDIGLPESALRFTLALERHRSATLAIDDEARPVRPVDEGTLARALVGLDFAGGAWRVSPTGELGTRDGEAFASVGLAARFERDANWRDTNLTVEAHGGVVSDGPAQSLYSLGGRGTLPGHPFRAFVGDRFWLLRAQATRMLAAPWLGARFTGSAGQAELGSRALPAGWVGDPDAGVKGSLGVGVSALWNVLRLDLSRGIGSGGSWEWTFSVAHRFRAWL